MKLSLVRWVDSRSGTDTWHWVDEIVWEGICQIISVGAIIHETADAIYVAAHVGREENGRLQVNGVMTIPRCSVISIETLCDLGSDQGASSMSQQQGDPGQVRGGQGKQKNEVVRNIGRKIEELEDKIDEALEQGQDTSAMEQQLEQLEQQMKQAQADRKAQRDQDKANRGQGGGRQNAPGQQKR